MYYSIQSLGEIAGALKAMINARVSWLFHRKCDQVIALTVVAPKYVDFEKGQIYVRDFLHPQEVTKNPDQSGHVKHHDYKKRWELLIAEKGPAGILLNQ